MPASTRFSPTDASRQSPSSRRSSVTNARPRAILSAGPPSSGAASSRILPEMCAIEPEDHARQLRPSGTHQTKHTDDFVAVHSQADGLRGTRPGHVVELEHGTAEGPRAARGIHLFDLASHHLPHEHVHRERGHAAAGDDGAIAQHRDAIAEAEHIPKLMRDIDDGQPRVAQLANECVEAVALGGTERCRRLVQDQHARLRPERPCDLHQLALAGREALDQRVQRALEPHALRQLRRRAGAFRAIDERRPSATREPREMQVLGDREIAEQRELLMDERDPLRSRVGRRGRPVTAGRRHASSQRRAGRRRQGCSSASTCPHRSRRRARAPRPERSPGRSPRRTGTSEKLLRIPSSATRAAADSARAAAATLIARVPPCRRLPQRGSAAP